MAVDGYKDERLLAMNDGTGLAEALLGVEGFRVLAVTETPDEVTIEVETTAVIAGCGHGFRRFEHYGLRVLLHAGGVSWPSRPSPPRIRTPAPHSNA